MNAALALVAGAGAIGRASLLAIAHSPGQARRSPRRDPLPLNQLADICVHVHHVQQASDADDTVRVRVERLFEQVYRSLPLKDRALLALKFDRGLTMAQIAVCLGDAAAATTQKRYQRLLTTLRMRLQEGNLAASDVNDIIDEQRLQLHIFEQVLAEMHLCPPRFLSRGRQVKYEESAAMNV